MRFIGLLVFALAVPATWAQTKEKDAAAIDGLVSAMKTLAQANTSCAKATDCLALEYGHRPCGGPEGFVVTSAQNKNLEELRYLGGRTRVRKQEFNKAHAQGSICAIEEAPPLVCEARACVPKR